ncbi:hypothetical protein [Intestinimonas massiliensis (ex Afouda et al. 2020)]|uniref:hypothetical protein n=1 Tax=Intestinimonas massiliensis (ex Afouda et al. 2020) TaxID=1673721 RepID=UPI00102FC5F9|nr:hypothetical protein [Intestinimonas massiliensis (ex Afouda et al. 2020)]
MAKATLLFLLTSFMSTISEYPQGVQNCGKPCGQCGKPFIGLTFTKSLPAAHNVYLPVYDLSKGIYGRHSAAAVKLVKKIHQI